MKYYQTKQRDGQSPKIDRELFASNFEEAKKEFSQNILSYIDNDGYSYFHTEEELKETFGNDCEFNGSGYYAMPETPTIGREDYYAINSIFSSYRHDVYTYGIEKVETFSIVCKENGDVIEKELSKDEAEKLIEKFEDEDKGNNDYTPDFYQIIETN